MSLPRLIGMVHLGPLPGAPRYAGSMSAIVDAAVRDAATLLEAGFDGIMVENFGDAPFYPDNVPAVTVSAMTRCISAVVEVGLPVGVNVLRNDGLAAMTIAAVTGAAFMRVNVLSGTMFTDQGVIEGRAAELARLRSAIGPDVQVMADVFVKHATPPAGLTITDAAIDLWERSGADGVIVSGTGTGSEASVEDVEMVHGAIPDAALYLGSGVAESNVQQFLATASGVIVGTSIKSGGTTSPVDLEKARSFVATAS